MPDNKDKYPKQQLELVKLGNEFNLKNGGAGLNIYVKNHSFPHDDPLYGKELKMTVFDNQLKTFVETQPIGAFIYADYTEEMKLDWLAPNYTIIQAYVNGSPIKVKRSGGYSTEAAQIIADALLKGLNEVAAAIRESKPTEREYLTPAEVMDLSRKELPYDMEDLLSDLKELIKNDPRNWRTYTVINDIAKITGETCSSVKEAVTMLNKHFPAEYAIYTGKVRQAYEEMKAGTK